MRLVGIMIALPNFKMYRFLPLIVTFVVTAQSAEVIMDVGVSYKQIEGTNTFCKSDQTADWTTDELAWKRPDLGWYIGYGNGLCWIGNRGGVSSCGRICKSIDGCQYFSVSTTVSCYACFIYKSCDSPISTEYDYKIYKMQEVIPPTIEELLQEGDCKPYSVEACQDAAKALGKYFRGPAYWTKAKGCYGYTTGEYKDFIFYSTGGRTYEMKSSLALPEYRPEGYDCKTYDSCFDGEKSTGEEDVDCGGPCELKCPSCSSDSDCPVDRETCQNNVCIHKKVCNDDWVNKDHVKTAWSGEAGQYMDCHDYAHGVWLDHPGHCSEGSKICSACGCNEGCSLHPCQNNGTCINTQLDFKCVCGTSTVPYTGKECEINLQINCGDHMAASCSDCPNENGPSGCDGDCMWGNSTVTGEQCILKDKVFATYEFETKRTYGGESINCGLHKNRKSLERACTESYDCIGYSTISTEHPEVKKLAYVKELEAENGFYPWCMKKTEGDYKADEQHNYYRRTRGIVYKAENSYLYKNDGKDCGDHKNYEITSEAACKEAAITHDLTYAGTMSHYNSPDCIYDTSKKLVFFNTNRNAWKTHMDEKYSPLCTDPDYEAAKIKAEMIQMGFDVRDAATRRKVINENTDWQYKEWLNSDWGWNDYTQKVERKTMCTKRIDVRENASKRECQMRCWEKNGCLGIIWGNGCGLCMNTHLEIGSHAYRFYDKPAEWEYITCPPHKPNHAGEYCVECANDSHCNDHGNKKVCHENKCFECVTHEQCGPFVQCVNKKCGCSSDSDCPSERPTCEDKKCINKNNPFQKIERGTFCISKDLDYLRTGDECKLAAKTLDLPYGEHFSGDNNPSCVYRENEKKIYFNRNGRARCLKDRCRRSKMDYNHAAICKEKGPEYEHATPTTKKCPGYAWNSCYRGCPCNSWKDEYCDKGRGVCMKVKDCEFMDHNLGGYVGGKQAALESAFDYNDKNGAISKCRETKACKGVFLRMPEGVWVLSTGQAPNPRYKGEGSIAIPMKCITG